jgi:phosphate transport system protein
MTRSQQRHFVQELDNLKTTIIRMGSVVEQAIGNAMTALLERRAQLAQTVIEQDPRVDAFEIAVDDTVVDLLALQQPVAVDLRFLVCALKINNELERLGDHAVNIAQSALACSSLPGFTVHRDLPRMGTTALGMLHNAIDGFIRKDAALCREVLKLDDTIDELNRTVVHDMVEMVKKDPSSVDGALEQIRVSRNLERVGDLSTNMAEEVIFMTEARVVKHRFDEKARDA